MQISFFFANDLLLAVYILYMEMMLEKKNKFEQFSCLSSKWVVKQQRQLNMSHA